jgi:GNAT superfamily N-acetyltransferase
MGYTLRAFTEADAGGVRDLILSILEKEYPFDRKAYSDSDLNAIARTYGGRGECFFVVEEGGQIVGTAGIKRESPSEGLLRRLFVDVKHRGRGYGGQLVDKALEFARRQGYGRLFFRCTDRMANAMRLCVKKGFKETEKLNVGGFNIHKLELEL